MTTSLTINRAPLRQTLTLDRAIKSIDCQGSSLLEELIRRKEHLSVVELQQKNTVPLSYRRKLPNMEISLSLY